MKKLIISIFMASLLCLCTVGFVKAVSAQEITKTITGANTDLVIETKLTSATEYEFTIVYDRQGDETEVIIKDTIPAEWNVTDINTNSNPVQEKDGTLTDYDDHDNGTFTVFRSGTKPKGNGNGGPKKNNSSTQICWTPDPLAGSSVSLVVTVETRNSPSSRGKKVAELKFAPTSCGLLVLNPGATAYEYNESTGELDLVVGPTDPLELVGVEDIDGGGVEANGSGDEDGDNLTDAEEGLNGCTSPCNPDTDGDTTNDDLSDTDIDGLTNWDELNIYGTLYCVPDTDGDGCDDGDDPNPITPSIDNDSDGIGADCDPDDDNECDPVPCS